MIDWRLLLVVVALSGCTGGQDSMPEVMSDDEVSTPPPSDSPPVVLEPTVQSLGHTDSLVAGVWTCVQTFGCSMVPEEAYSIDWQKPVPAGNVTWGNFTVSWTAAYPSTQEISVGYEIINPACSDCQAFYRTEKTGPSPLEFSLPEDLVFGSGDELHFWAYGGIIQGAADVYVGLSTDQEFVVQGAVAVSLAT